MRRELKILRKQILVAKKSLSDCQANILRARRDILDGDANDTLPEVERDALFASVQVVTNRSVPDFPLCSCPLLCLIIFFLRP